jgi:hypothetical protein
MTASEALDSVESGSNVAAAGQYPGVAVIWMGLAALQGIEALDRAHAVSLVSVVAVWMPLAIVGGVALGRRFFGLRRQVRWPEGTQIPKRLKACLLVLAVGAGLFGIWSLVASFYLGRHNLWSAFASYGMWLIAGWLWLGSAYIAERKPLPRTPPAFSWDGMQPIRSEHWGARGMAER